MPLLRNTLTCVSSLLFCQPRNIDKRILIDTTMDSGLKHRRKDARSAGDIHYYTGRKCAKGHLSPRYVSTGECCECRSLYDKTRYDGIASTNRWRRWALNNWDKVLQYSAKSYRKRNPKSKWYR